MISNEQLNEWEYWLDKPGMTYLPHVVEKLIKEVKRTRDVVEAAQEVALCGFENVHNRILKEALERLERRE